MSASYPECLSMSHDHRNFYWGVNHLSMSRPNLKFKIFIEILAGEIGGSMIFPYQDQILNLKFLVRFWSVRMGVHHSWDLSIIRICDFLFALGFT